MDINDPNDPLAIYVREVATAPPLTKDEETALFRQLGDSGGWDEQQENAARRLVESQLALVVNIAERHLSSGIPLLELIQEGNLGLMNAVRSFAETPVGDFTAHATACLEAAIAKAESKSK